MTLDPKPSGILFVVATPIGNVDDISLRARRVLADAGLIAAEDTRRTRKLLQLLGIDGNLLSCHEHNEASRVPQILQYLADGKNVALVSDAGTPLLSDPGYRLIRAAIEAGYTVSPVPGCSAVMAALSVAGLPTDAIYFGGFLPASASRRIEQLKSLASRTETLVFFESVHRIAQSLDAMIEAMGGQREAVAARELTKLHETIYRGTLADIQKQIKADPGGSKGEYTLVVTGAAAAAPPDNIDLDRALKVLLGYLGVRQAAEAASKILGIKKNAAYKRALQLREDADGEY